MITGGGTGIGAETTRCFAAVGASRIALLGRREQPLFETKFADVDVFVASTGVTKASEVDAAFAKFDGEGRIDILVSNAAVTGLHEFVRDVDGDKFLEAIHPNLKGSLYVSQAFLRYASTNAVVIDVSSSTAHLNFSPEFPSYGFAKMAVFRLLDSVAFANPEFSVFHIQPGVIDTVMNREAGGVTALGFEDDGKLDDGRHTA